MRRSESSIERSACKAVKEKFGILSIKLAPVQSTGWPDRLFWVPGGKPVLVEFKRPGERLTRKQEYIRAELQSLGYFTAVCTSTDEVLRTIQQTKDLLNGARLIYTRPE